MKITSSYGIEIKQMNKIFRPTVVIYNNAISFCVDVFENEWSDIELEKSTSVKKWSLIQAKVSECVKRTQCTYNTLVEILKVA